MERTVDLYLIVTVQLITVNGIFSGKPDNQQWAVCIPEDEVFPILHDTHDLFGELGVKSTQSRLYKRAWCQAIPEDCDTYVNSRIFCVKNAPKPLPTTVLDTLTDAPIQLLSGLFRFTI